MSTQHMIAGDSTITIVNTSESAGVGRVWQIDQQASDPLHLNPQPPRPYPRYYSVQKSRDIPILASAGVRSDHMGIDQTAIAANKHWAGMRLRGSAFTWHRSSAFHWGCRQANRPMQTKGAGQIPLETPIKDDC